MISPLVDSILHALRHSVTHRCPFFIARRNQRVNRFAGHCNSEHAMRFQDLFVGAVQALGDGGYGHALALESCGT
jgi:hypothetical protein